MMSKSTKKKPSITPGKDKAQPLIRQQSTFAIPKDKGKDDTTAKTTATHIVPESLSNPTNVANSPENSTTSNVVPETVCESDAASTMTTPKHTANLDYSAKNTSTNTLPGGSETIIAYLHNVSPLKRNKRNTIDYSTLTLQTGTTNTQSALCYSKSKRKILEEKQTARSPIKITRYTTSNDKTKVVINDRTIITTPDDLEYNFQYSEPDVKPITPLANLSSDNAALEDNITVCAKVVKNYPSKTVVSHQGGTKTVTEVLIFDKSATATMQLDLWNEQGNQIKENHAYRFTSLSASFWNNVKKLTTTFNTVIRESVDDELCSLQCSDTIPSKVNEHVIYVSCIHTIEDVNKYKTCCNCGKQILQIQESVVKCDYCLHMMRASSCPTKLYANVVFLNEGQKKSLNF